MESSWAGGREIQEILRVFRAQTQAGIVVHAIGNQGKSSLAARIANRLIKHKTILVYGKPEEEFKYTAYHVLSEFLTYANLKTDSQNPITLQSEVQQDATVLKAALKELLNGPFSGHDPGHPPLLVVVDDLEKILEPSKERGVRHVFQTPYVQAMRSLIAAFSEAETASLLLFTSSL